MARTGYSLADMIDSFKRVGIETGDTVFVHVCLERLGQPQDYVTSVQTSEFLMNALQEVVGPNGTILVPTYTFSFCERQPFDVQNTPTAWR
jgi:aminoglycoside 3-N-acetyltransferase